MAEQGSKIQPVLTIRVFGQVTRKFLTTRVFALLTKLDFMIANQFSLNITVFRQKGNLLSQDGYTQQKETLSCL